jgi:hypothetical protein
MTIAGQTMRYNNELKPDGFSFGDAVPSGSLYQRHTISALLRRMMNRGIFNIRCGGLAGRSISE